MSSEAQAEARTFCGAAKQLARGCRVSQSLPTGCAASEGRRQEESAFWAGDFWSIYQENPPTADVFSRLFMILSFVFFGGEGGKPVLPRWGQPKTFWKPMAFPSKPSQRLEQLSFLRVLRTFPSIPLQCSRFLSPGRSLGSFLGCHV